MLMHIIVLAIVGKMRLRFIIYKTLSANAPDFLDRRTFASVVQRLFQSDPDTYISKVRKKKRASSTLHAKRPHAAGLNFRPAGNRPFRPFLSKSRSFKFTESHTGQEQEQERERRYRLDGPVKQKKNKDGRSGI